MSSPNSKVTSPSSKVTSPSSKVTSPSFALSSPRVSIWRYIMGREPYNKVSKRQYKKRRIAICKNPNIDFVHDLLFFGSTMHLNVHNIRKYQYIIDCAQGTITPDEPTMLEWQLVFGDDAIHMDVIPSCMIEYYRRIRNMIQVEQSVPDELIAQYQKIDLEQMIQDWEESQTRRNKATQEYMKKIQIEIEESRERERQKQEKEIQKRQKILEQRNHMKKVLEEIKKKVCSTPHFPGDVQPRL